MTLLLAAEGIGSEDLWAEHGLTGLVLFGMFGLIIYLINAFGQNLKEERKERHTITQMHVGAVDKLSCAIDRMATSLKESSPVTPPVINIVHPQEGDENASKKES